MLPRRGKTYAKLVADNSDLIKKKPPMPRRGNTYASLVGRKNDLLMGGRVRSAVVKSPRTRDTRPSHQRKSTGSMLTEDTMKPPPLPPRKSSRGDTPTSRKKILPRSKTPPLKKSEPMDELPVVYVVSSSYFTHTFTTTLLQIQVGQSESVSRSQSQISYWKVESQCTTRSHGWSTSTYYTFGGYGCSRVDSGGIENG